MPTVERHKWQLPLKSTLILGMCVVVISAVALLYISGENYRRLSYENEIESLSELVGAKVTTHVDRHRQDVRDLVGVLQSRHAVRAAFETSDKKLLLELIDNQFSQWATHAQYLKLEKIYALDTGLNVLSKSTHGLFSIDDLKVAKKTFEQKFIKRKLEEHNNNVTQTAKTIGVGRSYLHKKLKN